MSGHVLTFGETMGLFRAVDVGDLAEVGDARIGTGGADSNVAIGLTRLGVGAVWVGRVGPDGLGRRVVCDIRGQGVDVRAIIDAEAPTGLMVKEKRTPHTTRVSFYRSGSAGSRLAPGDIDPELVVNAALVHITGITASISGSARETVHDVIDLARESQVPVSFDVNHRSSLWRTGDPAATYREIAAKADIIFAGEDEAALLTGLPQDDPEALAIALASGAGGPLAVVKQGAAGSLALRDGILIKRNAIRVPVIDSVGAGDAFVAGFLARYIQGNDVSSCLELATIAGAFACMGPGDWESMPRNEDLELLKNTEPVTR
ncbi:sugar kinase [Arthrobacter sp. MI7-26]|uniref:sugar kinase n=1 Tax=Arthrobacter sp. MI7-26 TaxID=2993653 RepID=UPI0022487D64|nr:sugar kinase [Arthrobacter sp. MI7-26]MCX2748740.1 sugar kinase [Arthrobacter sp. MI7-26]